MTRPRWLGLQGWLIAALIGVGCAASIAVLVTVLPTLEQTVRRDRAGDMATDIAKTVQGVADDGLSVVDDWTKIADDLADRIGGAQVRITTDGHVVGRSRTCCALLAPFPPISKDFTVDSQLLTNGTTLRVKVPLQSDGPLAQNRVFVEVAVPVPGGATEMTFVQRRVMFAVAVVFGLAALAGYALSRFIGGRIRRLADTASRLAAGDLSARAPLKGPEELATLGDGLNVMAARIEAQVGAITGERDRARVLISSLAEGVFSVREDSTLRMMNPSAFRLLDIPPDHPPTRVGELPPPLVRVLAAAIRDPRDTIETETVLRDGTELSVVTARLADPAKGLAVTMRDVTEERRLERARRDLVANVSHELKTPLAAIKGLLELLESDHVDDAHRREFLDLMSAEAGRLERLVEEQLQLARLDAGALPLERDRVDLDALAEGVADSRRPLADAAGVRLTATTPAAPVTVYADGARIEQILLILVDNALRHTGEGGRIDIGVSVSGTSARLSVADTGEGIAETDLPFVFDRFYRGDRSREGRSAGLGLAIARGLATAHGGLIDVTSRLGEGSTFTLRLPCAAAPTAEHPLMPDASPLGEPGVPR